MDEQEALKLVHHLGLPLPEDVLVAADPKHGGVAGAARPRRDGARRGRVRLEVADISGHERTIADYLRSEVLEQRSPRDVDFLTRTSILERLNGAVCDAVVGQPGSGELLADLARSTILLDEYGGSYRYHSLLREFLQDELEAREPGAARGAARSSGAVVRGGRGPRLGGRSRLRGPRPRPCRRPGGRRLRSLPLVRAPRDGARRGSGGSATTQLEERPWLAVLGAWEELASGDVAATEHLADIAERGSFAGSATGWHRLVRVRPRDAAGRDVPARAQTTCWRMPTQAVALEPAGSRWRDFALWMLAFAHLANGDEAAADEAMAEAIAAARAARNDGLAYAILGHRALLAMDRGDWAAATRTHRGRRRETAALQVEGYLSSAFACIARARIAIHRGDLGTARREMLRGVESAAAADRGGAGGGRPGPPGPRAGPPRAGGRAGRAGRARPGGPRHPSATGPRRPARGGGRDAGRDRQAAHRCGRCLRAHDRGAAGAGHASVLPVLPGDRAAAGRAGEHGQDARRLDLRQARRPRLAARRSIWRSRRGCSSVCPSSSEPVSPESGDARPRGAVIDCGHGGCVTGKREGSMVTQRGDPAQTRRRGSRRTRVRSSQPTRRTHPVRSTVGAWRCCASADPSRPARSAPSCDSG